MNWRHFPLWVRNSFSMLVVAAALSFSAAELFCAGPNENVQYRKFRFDDSTCDVGVIYKDTARGTNIGVSAIAMGNGVEFRRWKVTYIKLGIGPEKIAPDAQGKFYVTKESFFRIPAAVLFAAIGTQIDVGGSGFKKGIAKAGAAVGLGLLALQAKGEITGERSVFHLDRKTAEDIIEGRDSIEVIIENEDLHAKHDIKIGLMKPLTGTATGPDYSRMSREELDTLMGSQTARLKVLDEEQSRRKYGEGPEFDEIQRKIEALQAERGMAYKAWFGKKGK